MFDGELPDSGIDDLDLGYVTVITQTEAALRLGMLKSQVEAIPLSLLRQVRGDRPLPDSWDPLYLDTDVEKLRKSMGLTLNPLASDIYNQLPESPAKVVEELASELDELDHEIKSMSPQSIGNPQQDMARHALDVLFNTCHALTYAIRNLEIAGLDPQASANSIADLEQVQDLLASVYRQLSENFNLGFVEMEISRSCLALNEVAANIRGMTE